jgi:hypothetical protein
VKRYWLVALLAFGALVALVLIVYTWPQPRAPEAATQRLGTVRAPRQFVSAETIASVLAEAPDCAAARFGPTRRPFESRGSCV